MTLNNVHIHFPDSPEKELEQLQNGFNIYSAIEALENNSSSIPKDLKTMVVNTLIGVLDLLDITTLPDMLEDVESTILSIGRDISMSRVLRERGIFRLHRLTRTVDENGLPLFASLDNPETGEYFHNQKAFLKWFCDTAKVSRSLIFMRMATIERLYTLGYDMKSTFKLMLTKPSIIRKALNNVGTWNGGNLVHVKEDTARLLVGKLIPDSTDDFEEAVLDGDSEKFMEIAKNAIHVLVQDVATHERSREAMKMVLHDILEHPELDYKWDDDGDCFTVRMYAYAIDERGNKYVDPMATVRVTFIPDITEDLDTTVKRDILERLPFTNKRQALDALDMKS